MPADAGIDDRRACGLDGLCLLHDLLPVAAVLDQVHQRQAVDDDEVRTAGFTDAAHDLHREAHALAGVAAPAVTARVGARRDELVDEVALRAHHFHAVVAGLAGQLRGNQVQFVGQFRQVVVALRDRRGAEATAARCCP
ncbi:hypothetical protein G6F68_017569 [Rhizopus microsporus]|nr:hypothetical protein G6F68_017569 [Rhizopus microsporus]